MRRGLYHIMFFLLIGTIVTAQSRVELHPDLLTTLNTFNLQTINSKTSEFAPAFFEEGIMFAASEPEVEHQNKTVKDGPYYDLYYVPVNDFGIPSGIAEELSALNSDFHEGPVSFDNINNTLFLTRTNLEMNRTIPNQVSEVHLQLYTSNLIGGKWTNVRKWDHTSTEYSICHPSISNDGTRLYFASNMPGGFGGMDIYYSDNKDGKWSEPMNVGPQINTLENDWFPFIHASGALFFCSAGHQGFGGLDVFTALPEGENFSKPINMGTQINDITDQAGFVLNASATQGYYTSADSLGSVNDDIFLFDSRFPIVTSTGDPNDYTESLIQIRDKVTNAGIKNAIIEIYNFDAYKDDPNSSALYQGKTDENGFLKHRFKKDQELLILADAGIQYDIYEWVRSVNKIIRLTVSETELNVNPEIILSKAVSNIRTATIKSGAVISLDNIYYDYNKSEIVPGAAEELEILASIMKDYPVITIILTAHTDSRGTESFNQLLSEDRAKAAKDYLLKKGIDNSRISTLGMGESRLRNHCLDEVNCSEEEHQFNRRTEVRIVKAPAGVEIRYQE